LLQATAERLRGLASAADQRRIEAGQTGVRTHEVQARVELARDADGDVERARTAGTEVGTDHEHPAAHDDAPARIVCRGRPGWARSPHDGEARCGGFDGDW